MKKRIEILLIALIVLLNMSCSAEQTFDNEREVSKITQLSKSVLPSSIVANFPFTTSNVDIIGSNIANDIDVVYDNSADFSFASSSVVLIDDANDLSFIESNFSFDFVVSLNEVSGITTFFSKRASSGNGLKEYTFFHNANNNTLELRMFDEITGGKLRIRANSVGFAVGVEYHITTTFNLSTMTGRLYINGVDKIAITMNVDGYVSMENLTGKLAIGKSNNTLSHSLNGNMRSFKIFDSELSQSEVILLQDYTYEENECAFQDVEPPISILTIGSDISTSSVIWFNPQPSSLFPTLKTYGKDFIITYSSDHGGANKGVRWADADSPNMDNFQERGTVPINHNNETPLLKYYPNEERKTYLYVHGSSPTIQNTRLYTLDDDKYLHENWVSEGVIIEELPTYTHTGYFNYWENDSGVKIGMSMTEPQYAPDNSGWNYNVLSEDGKTATVGNEVDLDTHAPENYYFSLTYGKFFKWNDERFWIGTMNHKMSRGRRAKLGLAKANENMQITEFLTFLNNGEEGRTWSFYHDVDAEKMYCFLNNYETDIQYTLLDLTGLCWFL